MDSERQKLKKVRKAAKKTSPAGGGPADRSGRGERGHPESSPVRFPEGPRDREFLFQTFHDMRNPLQAIMGYTGLVLRKTREQIPEKQQENLGKVLQSAERLKNIIDRMVAFYRQK